METESQKQQIKDTTVKGSKKTRKWKNKSLYYGNVNKMYAGGIFCILSFILLIVSIAVDSISGYTRTESEYSNVYSYNTTQIETYTCGWTDVRGEIITKYTDSFINEQSYSQTVSFSVLCDACDNYECEINYCAIETTGTVWYIICYIALIICGISGILLLIPLSKWKCIRCKYLRFLLLLSSFLCFFSIVEWYLAHQLIGGNECWDTNKDIDGTVYEFSENHIIGVSIIMNGIASITSFISVIFILHVKEIES